MSIVKPLFRILTYVSGKRRPNLRKQYLAEKFSSLDKDMHTKLEIIADVVHPEVAWKAFDFLPYKGQRTNPLP